MNEIVALQDIVSIHAPAWGATCGGGLHLSPTASFNPRARVGRDKFLLYNSVTYPRFQSTRPRGARLEFGEIVDKYYCFNPRARVGRDFI